MNAGVALEGTSLVVREAFEGLLSCLLRRSEVAVMQMNGMMPASSLKP